MKSFNLLDFYALSRTQLVKLSAELLGPVLAGDRLQSQVELKLSPGRLNPEQGVAVYQVGVRLACTVLARRGDSEQKVFSVECILNAVYRQFHGGELSEDLFEKHHASLGRQLYPLVHHKLIPLFAQFGLQDVRLPYEIIQKATDEPSGQVH